MTETRSLYDILGIDRDAEPAAIKRAHRQKAKAHHPDTNPGEDAEAEFRAIQHAYEVLSDPTRRARYDDTGDAEEEKPDNSAAQLIASLSIVFNSAMAEIMGNGGDPTQVDLVMEMVELLLEQEHAIEGAQAQFARNRAVLTKMLGRFTTVDPEQPNHMEAMLRGQIADIDANVETNKLALEHARRPRLYLQGCRYRRQEPMGMFAPFRA